MRGMQRSVALVTILALPLSAAEKDKHSAKFGDLHVTAMMMEDTPSTHGDHHRVIVFLKVENAGKGVVCASFNATLRTTFELQYHAFVSPKTPLIMNEMLPGETHQGSYDFFVKNGVQPLELILSLSRGTIRCGTKRTEQPMRNEVRLDVHDLPAPEQDSTP